MKKFLLKNIVLAVILVLTLIGSIFLIFLIWGKSRTITQSMEEIAQKEQTLNSIKVSKKPNSVEESERLIKIDTTGVNKKKDQIYRRFGNPYRPALLKLISNISYKGELKTDLPVDTSLVVEPVQKPKQEDSSEGEDEEEVAESKPAEPEAPTEEELAVFDPAKKIVVLSYDEETLRSMLAELYQNIHQDVSSSDDSFVIPDTVQSEREQLFQQFFNQIIAAPDVVDPARAEDFRKAAAAKFAQAFALFREEVQEDTLENVTYKVAHELLLDSLGLPRLMRQRDCKNYIDSLYQKYLASDLIPGLPEDDPTEKERLVQNFIYSGKKISRGALPVPDMVIPIIRNFQIKEDLFRRMKDSGIRQLLTMDTGVFYGAPMDNNDALLVFTYTLEMTAPLEAIDTFINSLHAAYKDDRVYFVKSVKFSSPFEDLVNANAVVASHMEEGASTPARRTTAAAGAANQTLPPGTVVDPNNNAFVNQPATQAVVATPVRSEYELTDPHNPEYGKTLVGEKQDEIKCTIVVNYVLYRADNITPQ